VHLELDEVEAGLLKRILERYLGELRMEISNTEKLDWRREMHADEDLIKHLLQRLSS